MRRAAVVLLALLVAIPALAGRDFDAASSDIILSSSTPLGVQGWTMGAWAQSTFDTGTNQGLFSHCDSAAADNNFDDVAVFTGAQTIYFNVRGTPASRNVSGGNVTDAQWFTLVVAYGGNTDHRIYRDATEGSDSTDINPVGTRDRIAIGAWGDNTPSVYFDGDIGPFYAYGSALTQDQCESLGSGAWPPYVAPANLAVFVPMFGQSSPEPDVVGGVTFTVTGTSKVGHKNYSPRPGVH